MTSFAPAAAGSSVWGAYAFSSTSWCRIQQSSDVQENSLSVRHVHDNSMAKKVGLKESYRLESVTLSKAITRAASRHLKLRPDLKP